MNYTLKELSFGMSDSVANFSLYTIKAFGVTVFNYSMEETLAPIRSVPAVVDVQFSGVLIQTTDTDAGDYFISNLTYGMEGEIQFRQFEGFNNSIQAFFPQTDCSDVAMRFQDHNLKFKSEGNFLFNVNQGLFRQGNEECVINLIMIYGASSSYIVLGKPFLQSSNITVDYDRLLIGASGGKDLNPVKTNYVPRVLLLVGIFSFIALMMGFLVRFLNRDDLAKKLAEEEEKVNH